MKIIDCEQNSPEWYAARLGKFTASNMHRIISPLGKQSTSAHKYVTDIIAEIVTGQSAEKFKGNIHTERGKTLEDEAADYYAMLRQVELKKVGLCVTDDDTMCASPDRFVDGDGILEIKTCLSSIMVEYWEHENKEQIEQEHRPQTQCCLMINDKRLWIDTMLYCPGTKPRIVRSFRKTDYLAKMMFCINEAKVNLYSRLSVLREKGFIEKEAA